MVEGRERRGIEEQRSGVSGAARVALSNIPISITDSFPHPRPGHYPTAEGRQSSRCLQPVTKAAATLSCPSATQAALSTHLLLLGGRPQRAYAGSRV